MSIYVNMSLTARLRQRPFEHLLAVMLLISGMTKFLNNNGPFTSQLNGPATVLWAALSVSSGLLILGGLHWRGDSLVRSVIEQIGWTLAVFAALGGPSLLYLAGHDMNVQLWDDGLIPVAAALRIWYLQQEHRAIRRLRLLEIETAKASNGTDAG